MFQSDGIPAHLQQYAGKQIFVKEKHDCNIVFVSRKIRGSLQIHSFPVQDDLYAKCSAGNVDHLDENEIKIVQTSFEKDLEAGKGETYRVKTYNELGIIRLLEEIFLELNSPTRKNNEDNEEIYSKLIGIESDKLEDRVIKTFLKNNNGYKKSEGRYLKSIDGDVIDYNYVTQHGCSVYVSNSNSSEDSDDEYQTRELVVEFDDGGYVIIPFSGKSPKISVEKESVSYKKQDNIAYNYTHTSDLDDSSPDDQHIYTYISTDELNEKKTNVKENVVLRRPHRKPCTSDSVFDRYSSVYDYPHMGHFSLTPALSKQYIRDLSLEEVSDLLKVNLMKHHVRTFLECSIDGVKLSTLNENDLINLDFTKFEARKLRCFVEGWRPKNGSNNGGTWLSKLAKDWNVDDVLNYLLHINMVSLHRFASRHMIDGYLLKEMLRDDLIESLVQQHSLVLRIADINRLRNYVLEDDKPKFKFFQ